MEDDAKHYSVGRVPVWVNKSSGNVQWRWLHNTVNIFTTTEFYT